MSLGVHLCSFDDDIKKMTPTTGTASSNDVRLRKKPEENSRNRGVTRLMRTHEKVLVRRIFSSSEVVNISRIFGFGDCNKRFLCRICCN